MPVRRNIVSRLTQRVVGVHTWNGLTGEPVTISRENWDRAVDAADELYDEVVRAVDWNRILIEALGRHFQLDHDGEQPCGECVREALLYDERAGLSALHPWRERPAVPERETHPDWAAVCAELVRCRQPGDRSA
ncbi:hypothetical protein E1211_18000 [Micromonospora sp. 15K316]|uniref:hypothetical protein n=1 Tax=Micromonospora sp. 15K316 TaxID=2530376 RepID=UPI001051BFFC|nr:hypothetical protein [Micromonospora sp. 15K316]TDC34240.1 hypothetical protein E1211_18000 [Micromonospora sp. 15K316]